MDKKWRRAPAPFVFGALVIATVGAFFVTTRLKRAPAVIEKLTFTRHFSPNGDGRRDSVVFGFRLRRGDEATVSVVTRDGDRVRTLSDGRERRAHRSYHVRWDGRTSGGVRARDGEYHLRIGLRRQGRTVTSPRKVFLDTRPPRPVVRYVSPDTISPDGSGSGERATLSYAGPSARAELLVYRTDLARPRLIATRPGRPGRPTISWDGRAGPAGSQRSAPAGSYVLVVRTRDAAGNAGPPLPPRRDRLKGNPGLSVRYVAARGPLHPVAPGSPVRFRVFTDGRRYRWRIRRLGSSRAIDRGSSRAHNLTARAPRGRSGVALLGLRVGKHRYETPFAVNADRRRGILVVLPAATWQAQNAAEADGDGFPDTLPAARRVSLRRPFAGSGLPRGFSAREAPVLLYLARTGRRYDITTDLALAGAGTPPLDRYSGILFPSAPEWAPAPVPRLLRSYLRVGGRVAWIGAGGFLRTVTQDRGRLARPSRPRGRNVFGETVRPGAGGPLTVLDDRIAFFAGVSDGFGPFPVLEEAVRPPPAARPLAGAGARLASPAITVYRVPGGVLVRVGAAGFGRSLAGSPDTRRIMGRLWTLLSR